MVIKNNKYPRSLAEQKRMWRGEEGNFARRDLVAWFKIYNQTKLTDAQGYFKKAVADNDPQIMME